jgi:hypothetical protein
MGQSDRTHIQTGFLQYSHVDLAKIHPAQPWLNNALTFAPPQLTLAHGQLKLESGCLKLLMLSLSITLAVPVLGPRHLSSHAGRDEKNIKSTRPC